MITRLRIRGFKTFKDADLPSIGRLCVVTGPSGVGKTALLEAVLTLRHVAASGGPFAEFGGVGRVVSWGCDTVDLGGATAAGETLSLSASGDRVDGLYHDADGGEHKVQVVDQLGVVTGPLNHSGFAGIDGYKLDARAIAAASYQDLERPYLGSDGAGLASVLAYYAGAEPEVLREIVADTRHVLQTTRRLRVLPARVDFADREVIGHRIEVELAGVGFVPADLLNDGCLRVLTVMAALHDPDRPSVVIFDDLDRGLDARAQAALVDRLRAVIATDPTLQIIATAHGTGLSSQCTPDEHVHLEFDEHEGTRPA